ncbi:MAG: hypothetical protein Q8914_03085 [Bacteroidota bacterium]|nr:hypothetical protein [Bacteroidota bacterium]
MKNTHTSVLLSIMMILSLLPLPILAATNTINQDSVPKAKVRINNGNNSDAAILATTTAGNNLVVSSLTPDTQWGTVFKISHEFYNSDRRNGYIAVHRGGDTFGGFLDFGTNGLSRVTINQDGKFGIGTTLPSSQLDVAAASGDGLRIGKIGDTGNLSVPIDSVTARYNLDFTGYRDVVNDQIGARISAIRFNNYLANNALVQKTGLSFLTNPLGMLGKDTCLVERMRIMPNGNIGIGTTKPAFKLDVMGTIRATEVKVVSVGSFADFVFDKNYELPKLAKVGDYIQTNGHLPNIPSAKDVKENGMDLAEMQVKLLQKVEELTLYAIEQQKRIEAQTKKLEEQQARVQELERIVKEKSN